MSAGNSQQSLMPSSVRDLVTATDPKVTSLEVAVNTPSVNLCSVKRDFGEEAVIFQLVRQIVKLDAFLGLKNGINPEQAVEVSRMILDDYPYITFADFDCICNRAKRGYYGKMYERLSPSDIYQWVAEYFDKRCEYFEQKSIRQKHEETYDNPKPVRKTINKPGESLASLMETVNILTNQIPEETC